MEPVKKVASVEVGAAKNRATIEELNVGVANLSSKDFPAPKTDGIKIRGTGAATKGVMARGPMG